MKSFKNCEYKGYVKMHESATGETIIAPIKNARKWIQGMKKEFDDIKLNFSFLKFCEDEKIMINNK